MKTFCNNFGCKSNQIFFEQAPSDQHILELQDIFLEPGIHYIVVPTFGAGRTVIRNYLKALRCFEAPACFSLQQEDFEVPNIADQISAASLATYFELEFDADFLWIECDQMLLTHYPTLLMMLDRVTQQQHISIIILMIG